MGRICLGKSHHTRPGTWFVKCMGCTILYTDECFVSISHENVGDSIGSDHTFD